MDFIKCRTSDGFVQCCATGRLSNLSKDTDFVKAEWEVQLLCYIQHLIAINKSILRVDLSEDNKKYQPFLEELGFTSSGSIEGRSIWTVGLLSSELKDILATIPERIKKCKYNHEGWLYDERLYKFLKQKGKLRMHSTILNRSRDHLRLIYDVYTINPQLTKLHHEYQSYLRTLS